MKHFALAITAALVLSACGKGDGTSGTAPLVSVGISGVYKSADGKSTLNFNAGKVKIEQTNGRSYEYEYSSEGQSVKWMYEKTGIPESCETRSSTTIYCASEATIYTKID